MVKDQGLPHEMTKVMTECVQRKEESVDAQSGNNQLTKLTFKL